MKKEKLCDTNNHHSAQITGFMKGNTIMFSLSLFIVACFTLFSCQKEDDGYSLGDVWISMGFIEQTANSNSFILYLDNGDTLVPVSNAAPNFKTRDNQRVMVNYTVLGEVDQSTKKFYVKINNLYDILYKDIIELTSTNNDSIGNDPVHIDDIWKSNNTLNIEFSFLGGDVIHYINLVKQSGDINKMTQPIELQLRHNAKGDLQTYRLNSIVTFDLKNIKIAGQDSVNFIIKSTDYEGNDHTFNSTYYY